MLEKEMLNKMKKILAVLFTLTMIVSCLSLASAEEGVSAAEAAKPASRILVVYFSATGTTRGVAEKLAEGLSADLYEIVPEEPYTDADLNYNDSGSRTSIETDDPACRPAIAGELPDLTAYDTVFIGYPIWWAGIPCIVYTFLESHDFTGKTVIPFNTHEGSGQAGTQQDLENRLPGIAVLHGLAVRGSKAQFDAEGTSADVAAWLKNIGLAE